MRKKTISLMLLILIPFLISACDSTQNKIKIDNASQLESNVTSLKVYNLSEEINSSFLNLSEGIKLCKLISQENNHLSCKKFINEKQQHFCVLLKPNADKDLCLLASIKSTLDIDLCHKITDEHFKNACSEFVFSEINDLIKNNSEDYSFTKICNLIHGYATIGDVGYSGSEICLSSADNESKCEYVADNRSKNLCYLANAVKTHKIQNCNLITDVFWSEHCKKWLGEKSDK